MALAGEQAAGGIQTDPAGARQIDLAPGMQVGEVMLGAGRTIKGFHIGAELNQVTGNKARSQSQVTQQLHQQPGRVAARTGALAQGFLRRLHTGLQADQVLDVVGQLLVEGHQKIHAGQRLAGDAGQVAGKGRRGRQLLQVGRQLHRLAFGVGEGNLLGIGLEEEVERVEHRHLGDQIDLDLELAGLLGEHQTRQVVALRVLLPVDEVAARLNLQGIGQNARTTVRCRTQTDDLRTELHVAVVAIVGDVVQCDMDRHGESPARRE